MPDSPTPARDLEILEHLQADPDATQARLAEALGLAIGTVNFALRRLIAKGYVHAQQMERRRLKYILTPAGVSLRAKLAVDSLNYGMRLYREIRAQARALLTEVKQRGYTSLRLEGEGDLADIARLTCLEAGLTLSTDPDAVVLSARNAPLTVRYPAEEEN